MPGAQGVWADGERRSVPGGEVTGRERAAGERLGAAGPRGRGPRGGPAREQVWEVRSKVCGGGEGRQGWRARDEEAGDQGTHRVS